MPHDLTTMAHAARRMVLACYAHAHAEDAQAQAIWARLKEQAWVPTPEDCPVPWARVQAWVDRVQRLRVSQAHCTNQA